MKAVLMTSAGAPDVLQMGDLPTPEIRSERELLIKLKAAGVNPIDTKLRQRGTFYPDQMPAVLGCDGAGIVEAVGASVQQFQVGDEVYFCNAGLGAQPGNYAEYAVIDERFVAPKPKSVDFATAAAAPLVLITAYEALFDRAELQAGQTVLVHAGAGGVGHVAIQLAKIQGASVCTTVGSSEKADFVRQLGADHVIFYKETDFVQAVRDWTNGDGVDVGFDTVGGEIFSRTFSAIKPYGKAVSLLAPADETDWKTARTQNLRINFELMLTPMMEGWVEAQQHQADMLKQCAAWIDAGQLKIHVGHQLPLRQAAEAHRLLESGSMTGKIVLLIE